MIYQKKNYLPDTEEKYLKTKFAKNYCLVSLIIVFYSTVKIELRQNCKYRISNTYLSTLKRFRVTKPLFMARCKKSIRDFKKTRRPKLTNYFQGRTNKISYIKKKTELFQCWNSHLQVFHSSFFFSLINFQNYWCDHSCPIYFVILELPTKSVVWVLNLEHQYSVLLAYLDDFIFRYSYNCFYRKCFLPPY